MSERAGVLRPAARCEAGPDRLGADLRRLGDVAAEEATLRPPLYPATKLLAGRQAGLGVFLRYDAGPVGASRREAPAVAPSLALPARARDGRRADCRESGSRARDGRDGPRRQVAVGAAGMVGDNGSRGPPWRRGVAWFRPA